MIREMDVRDIPFVCKTEREIFGETLGEKMLVQELSNPFAIYLVMEDEEPIGYIGFWVIDDRAEIINFFIKKEYQGQGLGNRLLDYAITEMKIRGAVSLSLEVDTLNTKAINLYKKKGLKINYIREKYYSDGRDAYLMIGEI